VSEAIRYTGNENRNIPRIVKKRNFSIECCIHPAHLNGLISQHIENIMYQRYIPGSQGLQGFSIIVLSTQLWGCQFAIYFNCAD
jgi:hypothetical protein